MLGIGGMRGGGQRSPGGRYLEVGELPEALAAHVAFVQDFAILFLQRVRQGCSEAQWGPLCWIRPASLLRHWGVGPGSSRAWNRVLGQWDLTRGLRGPWVGTQGLPPGAVVPRLTDTHQHIGHSPGGVGGILGQHEERVALDRRGSIGEQIRWGQEKWICRAEGVKEEWEFFGDGYGWGAGAESQGAGALSILPGVWGRAVVRREGRAGGLLISSFLLASYLIPAQSGRGCEFVVISGAGMWPW